MPELRDMYALTWCGESYVSIRLFEHVDMWSVVEEYCACRSS